MEGWRERGKKCVSPLTLVKCVVPYMVPYNYKRNHIVNYTVRVYKSPKENVALRSA